MSASPFHPGESAAQDKVGVRDSIQKAGARLLRDFMPDEHRAFFEALPFLLAASRDDAGGVWASLLLGEPGFVKAPTPRRLSIDGAALPHDPLLSSARPGAPLGLLGIELATRRRNRVNGRVVSGAGARFELGVEQSFGNCKQYIQSRSGAFAAVAGRGPPRPEGARLSPAALELLARTDTSFIASSSREPGRGGSEGLDVSHRGGFPGFIHAEAVDGATRLTLPDYYGNFLFNTFGNLEVNPRAGLLALDFDSGGVLSLSGSARVIWDGPRVSAVPGAERLLELEVGQGLYWRDVLRDWSPPGWSPQLLELGGPE